MTQGPDKTVEDMLQRWRDSRGRSDAIDMWKAAKGVRIGEYAFTAVASDRSVLARLPPELTAKLLRDADEYVQTLRTIVGQRSPTESPAAAAIFVVSRAVADWRSRQAGARNNPDEGLAGTIPTVEETADTAAADSWKRALDKYPQFDETTGAMTLAAVVALGAHGLTKVREPWDAVMALGAARYIARAKRGDLLRPPPSPADVHSVISAIQEYAALSGHSPWDVGYTGRVGAPATQALRLARDAGICNDIASTLPDGAAAAGFQIWGVAEERHAFASMALDRGLVMGMPLEEARRFAAAAARHATTLKTLPDGLASIEAIGIPAGALDAVLLAARAIVPDGSLTDPRDGKSVEALDKKGVRYAVW
jgi:hypothetical protein